MFSEHKFANMQKILCFPTDIIARYKLCIPNSHLDHSLHAQRLEYKLVGA
jgi:hypothetical protein